MFDTHIGVRLNSDSRQKMCAMERVLFFVIEQG